MVAVKQKDNKVIDIQQSISRNSSRETTVEIVLPKNFEVEDDTKFKNNFEGMVSQSRRFHKGNSISTMLLYVKQLEKNDLPLEKFSVSLSLFAFLFNSQLKATRLNDTEDEALAEYTEQLDAITSLLNSFRDFPIEDEQKFDKFRNIDLVISFEFEQYLLRNLTALQSAKSSQDLRSKIVDLCNEEQLYRKTQLYGERLGQFELYTEDTDKLARLTNKMEMQKRIAELPLKLNTNTTKIGNTEKYLSIGISTGIIMLVFGFIMLQSRVMGLDTNLQFLLAFALLYVFRDIFKESFKERVFRRIMVSKPRSKATITFPGKTKPIGFNQLWLSESLYRSEQKQRGDNSILIKEETSFRHFEYHGFKTVKTDMHIDFSEIMKLIPVDGKEIYVFTRNDKPKKIHVPRRLRVDLIVNEKRREKGSETSITKRFRLLLDRNKIIRVEDAS
nr:hypothetical protein [Vibrio splendidus]MCC4880699.1 hypothetical protein [Vibrio splendidus]